jgi:hypothetical protein
MSPVMHYLDLGLGAAMLTGACWWMYALTSRSYALRKLEKAIALRSKPT